MNKFVSDMKSTLNTTTTENGAIALSSTMNACLDMFGSLGAMRHSDEEEIVRVFSAAFAEDQNFSVKMAFYFRDIRGGQGARRQFRIIMKYLADHESEYVIRNFDSFLLYGRGDDLLCLLNTSIAADVIQYMKGVLRADYINMKAKKPISMLAKWMPSENTSSPNTKQYARKVIKGFEWTPKQYRKLLSMLRAYLKVVEVDMSAQKWDTIDYEAVPSKAAMLYGNAFMKHDEARYTDYLTAVVNGKAVIHAATLDPVDIVHRATGNRMPAEWIRLDAMWNHLPNYLEDKEETGICVVDVSGSMCGEPMDVAISLGLYCADKCRGPFAKHFITFSAKPQLVEVKGDNIVQKVANVCRADWGQNTDLEAVFDLLLKTAVSHDTPAEDMPQKLYIISDMQFDEARRENGYWYRWQRSESAAYTKPFMEQMKQKYAICGYTMPTIVYWNVRASDCGMFQQTFEGENCCMVSGYSPSLFKAVIEGTTYEPETIAAVEDGKMVEHTTLKAKIDPMDMMRNTVNNERYDAVWVRK